MGLIPETIEKARRNEMSAINSLRHGMHRHTVQAGEVAFFGPAIGAKEAATVA